MGVSDCNYEMWRVLTSLWMHSGLFHTFINLGSLILVASPNPFLMELQVIYFLPSIVGILFVVLFVRNIPINMFWWCSFWIDQSYAFCTCNELDIFVYLQCQGLSCVFFKEIVWQAGILRIVGLVLFCGMWEFIFNLFFNQKMKLQRHAQICVTLIWNRVFFYIHKSYVNFIGNGQTLTCMANGSSRYSLTLISHKTSLHTVCLLLKHEKVFDSFVFPYLDNCI